MNTHNTDWHNLYGKGWSGIITPESFGHPAKFSRGLIRHIYQHLFDEGWLQPGDTVLDPFGGVALGALHALQRGLHWVGVELEQKFVDLGQQNIDLWNARFGPHLPNWGSAVLLQGDSRRLVEVVREAGGLVSSPPYVGTSVEKNSDGIDLTKQYQTYRASGGAQSWEAFQRTQRLHSQGYGTNSANLGNMAAGDPGDGHGVDGVIGSPPYAESLKAGKSGIDWSKRADFDRRSNPTGDGSVVRGESIAEGYSTNPANLGNMPAGDPGDGHGVDGVIGSPPFCSVETCQDRTFRLNDGRKTPPQGQQGYGTSEGQLAAMPPGPGPGQVADGLVGSPPYAGSAVEKNSTGIDLEKQYQTYRASGGRQSWEAFQKTQERHSQGYGNSDGQLGQESGTTFWSAAHTIVSQCYQVLKVGAPAVWVVKSFVRKGKRVDFPGQWRQLCESCGFETVHEHRAYLTEDRGNVRALFGFEMENGDARIAVEAGSVMHRKGKELKSAELKRASFFRRLAERNARADKLWPTVSRDDRAAYLWQSHDQLWRQYRRRMAGDLLPSELPEDEPSPPTRTGILRNAKTMAYVEAGSPDIEIATQIDYEVILCTVKR